MSATKSKIYSPKKRIKRPGQGWHREDIKAELRKRGWTLRRVAIENGYAERSAQQALGRSWPNMERIIADILEVEPWEIWPDRYNDYGQPVQDGNPNMVKVSHTWRSRNVDIRPVNTIRPLKKRIG